MIVYFVTYSSRPRVASVSFARGQHLTRSCTPWRALPTTSSHEAQARLTFTCNSTSGLGGRPVLAALSSSHEAAAAFDIPSPSLDSSQTVHSEVEVIINKASRTIIKSISSYLCTVAQTGVRSGKELRIKLHNLLDDISTRFTQTLVIQPAERVVISTRSRWFSHEAVTAFDIPSPSWDPSETVHSEVEVISIKHQ